MSLLHTTLGSNEWRSDRMLRSHGLLKCLAQCHVVLGLIIFILAALADYMSSRIHTIRMIGLEECCSFYFILTGIIGICGSASHRRGLILAFMVMNLHAILIFVPAIVIVSSFDIHFYQAECFGECDWHLLATSLPENSRCQILCGENIDDNKRSLMTRLGTEYRLDAGIIAATILQLVLSLFSASLCCREICIECQPIMWNHENQQLDMIMPLNLQDGASN
ncbi:Uncharacterized protein BM_BM5122 [Brugia malayi]|uniref:Bm5122 n=1 Tax=Brugia malayi TaxID=6279 RepID=A0A0H5SM29_BRUMA|nr:Uncharacterized protein BM_BM5122 [Brugia malayi]CRZ24777.1 Bm5122 [Brugia malayi]VIO89221.1 Uncharacterized protein BM_BM5122 [Brugia malayi]